MEEPAGERTRSIPLLFMLAFVVAVDAKLIAPVLPSIAASLGGTVGQVGLAMTTFSFAFAGGQLVYGPLSDHYGRVAVVRLAGLGFVASAALAAVTHATWTFVAVRLLAGAFAGAVGPLTLAHIGDCYPPGPRQVMLGRFNAVISAGFAFSATVGGTVAQLVSWRYMLVGASVVGLVPVALMFSHASGRRAQPAAAARAAPARYRDFLADPWARLVYLSVLVETALLWGGVTYLVAFAIGRYGLDQLEAALLIAVFGAGTVGGGLAVKRMMAALSGRALALWGGALMGGAYLAILPRLPWPVFALAMLALGIGYALLHTVLQHRGTEISTTARGKAFSLFAMCHWLGIAIGAAALGVLVDNGRVELAFAICGVGLIALGIACARHKRRVLP